MTCIKAISVSINFMITATTSISLDTVNHITTNMESKTIVKVVTVLTLAIINPREFRCTATSSLITQEPLFSKTNSLVALTFCGQIKLRGITTGKLLKVSTDAI